MWRQTFALLICQVCPEIANKTIISNHLTISPYLIYRISSSSEGHSLHSSELHWPNSSSINVVRCSKKLHQTFLSTIFSSRLNIGIKISVTCSHPRPNLTPASNNLQQQRRGQRQQQWPHSRPLFIHSGARKSTRQQQHQHGRPRILHHKVQRPANCLEHNHQTQKQP